MKSYIDKLISDIIYNHLRRIRLEKLSITERVALELAIAKLSIIRDLINKFKIEP